MPGGADRLRTTARHVVIDAGGLVGARTSGARGAQHRDDRRADGDVEHHEAEDACERPAPCASDVWRLVDEAREAGQEVAAQVELDDGAGLEAVPPAAVGRSTGWSRRR